MSLRVTLQTLQIQFLLCSMNANFCLITEIGMTENAVTPNVELIVCVSIFEFTTKA